MALPAGWNSAMGYNTITKNEIHFVDMRLLIVIHFTREQKNYKMGTHSSLALSNVLIDF